MALRISLRDRARFQVVNAMHEANKIGTPYIRILCSYRKLHIFMNKLQYDVDNMSVLGKRSMSERIMSTDTP